MQKVFSVSNVFSVSCNYNSYTALIVTILKNILSEVNSVTYECNMLIEVQYLLPVVF